MKNQIANLFFFNLKLCTKFLVLCKLNLKCILLINEYISVIVILKILKRKKKHLTAIKWVWVWGGVICVSQLIHMVKDKYLLLE